MTSSITSDKRTTTTPPVACRLRPLANQAKGWALTINRHPSDQSEMTVPLEYHVVVHALEGRSGWTPMARFASAVAHTMDGHLPYARYHAAGAAGRRVGMGEGAIERLIGEWLVTDMNPAAQIIGSLTRPANAVWALNAYTHSVDVGVRTRIDGVLLDASGVPCLSMSRALVASADDPSPCRVGAFSVMDSLVRNAARNGLVSAPLGSPQLTSVARHLGVACSAAAETVAVFERDGPIAIVLVAKQLGCHQRTLERRLREEGVTAELLRRAVRLVRATGRLRSSASLTTIAIDEGFSDLAHMSRAFKASCGMSASLLRRAARGGVLGERSVLAEFARAEDWRAPAPTRLADDLIPA